MIPQPTPEDLARDAEHDRHFYVDGFVTGTPADAEYGAQEVLPAWIRRCHAAESRVAELQKFKTWVHGWLDSVGVPHDPDPAGTAEHGCRISGRMRWLLSRHDKALAAMREACARVADAAEAVNLSGDHETDTSPEAIAATIRALPAKPSGWKE